MKDSGVYRIRNIINDKIYIGSASVFKDRKHTHFSLLRRDKHHSIVLQRAYKKYGKDKFVFEIVEKCDKNVLLEREQYYMDTLNPEYNCSKIAGRTIGVKSSRRRPVIQYDLSGNKLKVWDCLLDVMKAFNLSNSSKITKCCNLERNKCYGFVWRYADDNIKFSIRTKMRGKHIAQVNEDGEIIKAWETLKECAREFNVPPSRISVVCNNKNRYKTLNGKLFKYMTPEEIDKYRYLIENQ